MLIGRHFSKQWSDYIYDHAPHGTGKQQDLSVEMACHIGLKHGTSSGGRAVCTPNHYQYESYRGEVLRVNEQWVNTAWKTNTERPPEDVPCLLQTAANMKDLGTLKVCKPEPEIRE